MIKKSERGNPVFDITQGFILVQHRNGKFGYVNHFLKFALPTWPTIEQVEFYKSCYLATPETMKDCEERYASFQRM